MQRRTVLTALGTALAAGMGRAFAQAYPSAPVKMIVPYAAGGGIDAVARLMAQGMGEVLKQSFIVDNRAGAGGMVGADVAAKAAPDGYTVLFAGNPELTIAPSLHIKPPYAPLNDFTPIMLASQSPNLLVANASLGAKTLRAALEAARKAPGGITICTPGTGTPQHIAVELLRSQLDMDIVHVPYKGAAPATVAVLGGEVAFALVGAPPLLQHLRSGKLVGLAVTQPKRSPLVPDVPTMGEALGIMRDDDLVAWYGLLAPARTSPRIVQQLENAASTVLQRPETGARLAALGTDLIAMSGGAFAERMRRETKQYGDIIRRFGITAT